MDRLKMEGKDMGRSRAEGAPLGEERRLTADFARFIQGLLDRSDSLPHPRVPDTERRYQRGKKLVERYKLLQARKKAKRSGQSKHKGTEQ